MTLAMLAAVAAAAVPPVSIGPDDISAAPIVSLPIRKVVVFPGRARILRRGRVRLSAGPRLVRLPLLPGGLDPTSLLVEATSGAEVLSSSGRVVESTSERLAEAESTVARLEALARERMDVKAELEVQRQHLGRLDSLLPSTPPPEAERKGRLLPMAPRQWEEVLGFVQTRFDGGKAGLRQLEDRDRRLAEEQGNLQTRLNTLEGFGFVSKGFEAGVLLAVKSGEAELEVSYEVPGPMWSPSYQLRYLADTNQVEVVLEALVRQSTGEDWKGAALELSTALPRRELLVPELQTWVLGEREDLRLVPRARRALPVPPSRPWPALPPTATERARLLRLQRYSSRRQAFGSPSSRLVKDLVLGAAPPSPPPPSPPPPLASKAPSREARMEGPASVASFDDVAVTGAVEESAGRRSSSPRFRSTSLALFERASPYVALPGGLPTETGGADLRYPAAGPAPIPSGVEMVAVPISRIEVPVKPFHRATPSLAKVGFLRAEVANPEARPWLAGPAKLYAGDEPIGQVRIRTTGPGGKVNLPLGRDERLEVARRVVSRREKTGFLNGRRKQIFDVTLELVNHADAPTLVEVLEPIPVAVTDKVDVKLLNSSPPPEPLPPDKMQEGLPRSGIMTYRVEVAAKGKREILLSYEVEHSGSDRVVQQ